MRSVKAVAKATRRVALGRWDEVVLRAWARAYHRRLDQTWLNTRYLGRRTVKLPADLWIYQEIIWEVRPGLVVETGTMNGGSALYLAHLLDIVGSGHVVSIDVDAEGWDLEIEGPRPNHDRITYVTGSSSDLDIAQHVIATWGSAGPVMVILDSDHSRDHVLAELEAWAPYVTVGSYLIVEDGNVNGHPVLPRYGPGPTEALERWLPQHPEFEVDRSREKFMHTFNPGGYLRRLSR